ncbi:hypothetical protein ACFWPK_26770 [Nocardia sp. NPDC058519]|uniref:hypothetical protein n=1 Tax=Nocardia sp. NPDC058519 TaxID=3346535 RepID=UPI00365F7972
MKPTPLSGNGLMPVHRPSDQRPRLDALSTKGIATFTELFTAAPETTASDFGRLTGDLVMRSFPATGTRLLGPLMDRPAYFWVGKSFRHVDGGMAFGHNIFRLLGGMRALNFVATVGASSVDGRAAVRLDYDDLRAGKPGPAHRIYDELREIEPGLWLGPSYFKRGAKLTSMGWFALDASIEFDGPL